MLCGQVSRKLIIKALAETLGLLTSSQLVKAMTSKDKPRTDKF